MEWSRSARRWGNFHHCWWSSRERIYNCIEMNNRQWDWNWTKIFSKHWSPSPSSRMNLLSFLHCSSIDQLSCSIVFISKCFKSPFYSIGSKRVREICPWLLSMIERKVHWNRYNDWRSHSTKKIKGRENFFHSDEDFIEVNVFQRLIEMSLIRNIDVVRKKFLLVSIRSDGRMSQEKWEQISSIDLRSTWKRFSSLCSSNEEENFDDFNDWWTHLFQFRSIQSNLIEQFGINIEMWIDFSGINTENLPMRIQLFPQRIRSALDPRRTRQDPRRRERDGEDVRLFRSSHRDPLSRTVVTAEDDSLHHWDFKEEPEMNIRLAMDGSSSRKWSLHSLGHRHWYRRHPPSPLSYSVYQLKNRSSMSILLVIFLLVVRQERRRRLVCV
jgi:hypothetical protein